MEDSQTRDPSESAIRMPGALSVEETLAPGESKTLVLKIPPDYDFLLERITCPQDGPVLLTINVAQPPESTRAASRPTQVLEVMTLVARYTAPHLGGRERNAFNDEMIIAGVTPTEGAMELKGRLKEIEVDCGIISAS